MSFSDSFQPGQQQPAGAQSAAGLSLNLSSNNPFRNRAASPASIEAAFASPASPFDDPPRRPLSRNPFLDQALPPLKSPGAMSSRSETKSLSAEDIFVRLPRLVRLDMFASEDVIALLASSRPMPAGTQPG
ncbi:Protein PAL1 [Purpureocillium lavendulum]|uniref:Protein PAL1 n=1 Tax=Purpureocillium lavendulum TaxID=1247861 RepID=A0AB34FXU2_9HYPO|nr:Protein PAL1 [Purpureocillium lavendulum]